MTFDQLRCADFKYPTVALFYGLACPPCERLKPKLIELCKRWGVRLETFNSGSEMNAIKSLGLRSVPAVVVVHRGGIVQTAFTGDLSVADIRLKLLAAGVTEG